MIELCRELYCKQLSAALDSGNRVALGTLAQGAQKIQKTPGKPLTKLRLLLHAKQREASLRVFRRNGTNVVKAATPGASEWTSALMKQQMNTAWWH